MEVCIARQQFLEDLRIFYILGSVEEVCYIADLLTQRCQNFSFTSLQYGNSSEIHIESKLFSFFFFTLHF